MIRVIKSLCFHDDPDMTIEELVNLKSHYMDLNKKKKNMGYNLTRGSVVTAFVSICMYDLDQYK